MSQTAALIHTLKRCLRAKGLTYRDVAAALGLSESSVKRLFSEKAFSIQRLEEVCRLMEMSLFELSRLAAYREDHRADQLTNGQEAALAADPLLLSYFYLLLVGWKPYRIARRLRLDEAAHDRYLNQLDRLGLIELFPRRRVRLLTDIRIRWTPDGPVRRRYESQVKRRFVDHAFGAAQESLSLESSELSDASISVLLRRIDRLVEEFAELTEIDRHLPQEQKRSFAILMAARPWTFWDIVGEFPAVK